MLLRVLHGIASGSWSAPNALIRSTERWRSAAILSQLAFAFGLAVIALLAYALFSSNWRVARIAMYGLNPPYFALLMFARHRHRLACERFKAEIRERDFKVCYECGYDLSGHDTSERCPECGTNWTPESLEKQWRDWMWKSRPL